jgi:hypothetical protein
MTIVTHKPHHPWTEREINALAAHIIALRANDVPWAEIERMYGLKYKSLHYALKTWNKLAYVNQRVKELKAAAKPLTETQRKHAAVKSLYAPRAPLPAKLAKYRPT